MDTQSLYALLAAHQYALFAALVIGALVRLCKTDTKLPVNVPPRLRVWLAFALGAVAGVLEKIGAGVPWKQAAFDGAFAAVIAVLGQNVLVDSLRGGKEVPIPGLMIEKAEPKSKVPPTIPPPAIGALMLVAVLGLAGCRKFWTALDLASDKAKCVVANQDLPNIEIFKKCAVEADDIPKYIDLLSASREATEREISHRAATEMGASTRVDAGAPCPADAGPRCTDGGAK